MKSFLLVSTTHGLKYLTNDNNRPSKKAWSVFIGCCLALALASQIVPSISSYNQMYREREDTRIGVTPIQVASTITFSFPKVNTKQERV